MGVRYEGDNTRKRLKARQYDVKAAGFQCSISVVFNSIDEDRHKLERITLVNRTRLDEMEP